MTAPDTNTLRDGLTDDQINNLWYRRECFDAIVEGNLLEQVRCVVRSAIAADREARPAPASVEALTKWRQLLLGYGWSETDSTPGICLKVADEIRSALAASTPPAEAQPAPKQPVVLPDWWEPKIAHTSTRPASEARATGDAARYATDLANAIWAKHYKTDAPHWKPLDDILGVLTQIDNMTTGLSRSDRSTGAVPAGFVLMPAKPDDDWFRRVLKFARVWPDDDAPHAMIGPVKGYHAAMVEACASALAAPPVAPADAWTVIAPDGTRFDGPTPYQAARLANAHGRKTDPVLAAQFDAMQEEFQRSNEAENARLIALHGSLDCPTCGGSGHVGETQRAATGAAGEPQPREVNK